MTQTIESPKPARHMLSWSTEEKQGLWRMAGLTGKDFDNQAKNIAAATHRSSSAVVDAYYRFVHQDVLVIERAPMHYLVRYVIDRLNEEEG
jgi:hypothetical protein